MQTIRRFLVLATCLILAGCGGGGGGGSLMAPPVSTPGHPNATLSRLDLTPASPTVAKGAQEHFTATGVFSDGSRQDLTAQAGWHSSAAAVASIGTGGIATALGPGQTSISATADGMTAQTTLTVTAATLQSVQVTPVDPVLVLGTAGQLTARGTFSDKTSVDISGSVTWSANPAGIVLVSSTGQLTPLATGTTTVTATDPLTGQNASVKVTVTAARASTLSFAAPRGLVLQAFTSPACVGDLNGDNIPDVVVTSDELVVHDPKALAPQVFLGHADGSFTPVALPTLSFTPSTALLADLNHDGRLDLVVAAPNSNGLPISLATLLGNGDGTFQAEHPVIPPPAVTSTQGLAAGDVDGDGNVDLILTFGNGVTTLRGNGDGTFSTQRDTIGITANVISVADFNQDGRADILATTTFGNTSVEAFGQADGTFSAPVVLGVTEPVTVGDLNRDGFPDVVGTAAGNTQVLLNDKHGNLAPGQTLAAAPFVVALIDRQGQGLLDLLSAGGLLLPNLGDGTFSSTPQTVLPGLSYAGPTACTDINNDGRPDLLFSTFKGVAVAFGQSGGVFQGSLPSGQGPLALEPQGFCSGDFNRDGNVDAVVSVQTGLQVLLGQGNGTFVDGALLPTSHNSAVAAGDITGDGRLSIVSVGTVPVDGISVFVGQGDGTFSQPAQLPVPAGVGQMAVALADVNHDGRADLIVQNGRSATVSVYLSKGDGTFQSAQVFATDPTTSSAVNANSDVFTQSLAVADVNGDGRPDLLVANNGNPERGQFGTLSILLGNGDGTFQTADNVATHHLGLVGVAVADVTGDSVTDVIVTEAGDFLETGGGLPLGGVEVFPGRGDGTLGTPLDVPTLPNPLDVAVSDLDGDGRPDLVVTNAFASFVGIMKGLPGGQFQAPVQYAAGSGLRGILVADVNKDGLPDIVCGDQTRTSFTTSSLLQTLLHL